MGKVNYGGIFRLYWTHRTQCDDYTAIFNLTLMRFACTLPGGLGACVLGPRCVDALPGGNDMEFDSANNQLIGKKGHLVVQEFDEITKKLAMLIEGECEGAGPTAAAQKFGYTKQRYFQIRTEFAEHGATGLVSKTRGPKTNYRRTPNIVKQVIRYRFLDPDSSADVIAQKLKQLGNSISVRTVERVIAEYGLQKKTLQVTPRRRKQRP